MPYSEAMKKGKIQGEVLMKGCSQINSIDELNLDEIMAEIELRFRKNYP